MENLFTIHWKKEKKEKKEEKVKLNILKYTLIKYLK